MKETVIGVRKDKSRPYYSSFWYLDHKNGDWSVHQSRKDAIDYWRAYAANKSEKPHLTWIKCSERGDLIEWINAQRSEDLEAFKKTMIKEKQFMVRSLVGVGDDLDDGN